MAETFAVTQTTVATPGFDADNDNAIDPGERVTTTVTITNQSTTTNANGVVFTENANNLNGMTLVDQPGLDDINISPIAFNDSFTAVGNTLLRVGGSAGTGPEKFISGGNLFTNDVEFFGETFQLSAFDATSAQGGTVVVNTDGTFTYISDAGYTGTDTFTYTITDAGLDGNFATIEDNLTSVGTVTITVADQVWYVDSSFTGTSDGTSTNPFKTLADVNGAGDPDGDGDYIYLNTGTGDYTGGIVLESNQKLVGEGSALIVDGFTLAAAGTDATIVNTAAGGHGVTLAQNNTLTGFTVGNTNGYDIANTAATSIGTLNITNVTLNGSGGLIRVDSGGTINVQLDSATTTAAGTKGIHLQNVDNSTFTVSGVTTINDASQDGIDISNSQNSTFTFTGKTTILNDGGANGDGIDLQANNATDSTFNFNGGIDITVNGTGAFGFRAQSSGVVNILDPGGNTNQITSSNGTALFINPTQVNAMLDSITSGGGANGVSLTGMTGSLTVNGAVTIDNSTGDGLVINGSGGNVNFGSVSIDNVAGDGIDISGDNGNITISGGNIGGPGGADPNGIGVDINGAAGDTNTISIAASITKTTAGDIVEITGRSAGTVTLSGNLSATGGVANGIDVNNNTGGTINFTGQTQTLNTGANVAVSLQTNGSAAINFNPTAGGDGLDITTSTNAGFNASGGVVTVQGAGNTINATAGGTALNLVSAEIGAAGLTFQSISSNNAFNGIVLNNTGTGAGNGGLTVTGDTSGSPNGSGGTIAGSTGAGIVLTNTRNVSLDQMNIQNGGDDGIRATNVVNFTLTDSNVTNNGNADEEHGIDFTGVTGNIAIDDTLVRGSFEHNFKLTNTSGTINTFNVTDSTFDHLSIPASPAGGNGLVITLQGTAVMTDGSISNSTFRNNFSNGILVNTENSSRIGDDNATSGSTNGFVVSGSTFDDNNIAIQFGVFHSSDMTVDIQGNTIVNDSRTATSGVNSTSNAVVVGSSALAEAGSTLNARIENNTIGNAAIDGSASSTGSGIRVFVQGEVDATILINNNTISEAPVGYGIEYKSIGSATSGLIIPTHDITITNNDVDHTNLTFKPGTSNFPLPAISVQADNAGSGGIVRADIAGNTVPNIVGGEWIPAHLELYEYDNAGAADGNLQLVDRTPTGAASATAELQANNTGSAGASSGVSLITGAINLPPDLTPLPLLAGEGGVEAAPLADTVDDTPPPADTTAAADITPPQENQENIGGSGDTTPAAETPSPSTPAADPVIVDDGILTQAELDYIVEAAILRWTAAGLTEEQIAALNAMEFAVADMGGLYLGSFTSALITIDSDAAGWGWFLDGTPLEDSEFGNVLAATRMRTDSTGAPAGQYDLLTAVMHEMGHALGLSDTYAAGDADELMFGWLYLGERRIAGEGDADGAVVGAITTEEFLGSPINIGVLPAGQSVTIQWQATVNAQSNQLIVNPSNQGNVSATNAAGFDDTLTDGDTGTAGQQPTVTTLDTLTLGGTVWNDNGAGVGVAVNGLKDGAEAGIDSVFVTLFADTGTTAGVWDASDVQIGATIQTSGGGNYSFTGLAPGEYIVRIDTGNFTGVGALNTISISSPGGPDPDDGDPDTDNDDNGVQAGGGQETFSRAITLAYNTEPTAGASNDTNTTLDFGFFANAAPVIAGLNGDTRTFSEGGTPLLLDDQALPAPSDPATVTDANNTNFAGGNLTVSITANAVATEDSLSIATSSLLTLSNGTNVGSEVRVDDGLGGGLVLIGTISSDGENGSDLVISFNSDATPARVNVLLQNLLYFNSNTNNPSALARTIQVSVDDGLTGVGTANVTVNIEPTNDTPVNTVPAAQTVNEDTNLVFNSANGNLISIADVDAGSGDLKVTLSVLNGVLTLATTAGLAFDTGDGTQDATMTFAGTVSEINAALNGLIYRANLNYSGGDTVTIVTNDQGLTGTDPGLTGDGTSEQDSDTVTISVTAVNDDPAQTGLPTDITVTEDTLSNVDLSAITLTDVDSGAADITLTIAASAGTLTSTGDGFVTVDGTGTSTLVLTGTVAELNTFLNVATNIKYTTALNAAGQDVATLTLTANDGGASGTGGGGNVQLGIVNIDSDAVNDTPVNTAPAATQVVDEDTNLVFNSANSNLISIADVDAGSGDLKVTLSVLNGVLTLATTAGLTFDTGDGAQDATMTFAGTVSEINAALNGLIYRGDLNYFGADTLSIVTNDQGLTGTDPGLTGDGTSEQDSDTVAISVSAVNDAPTLATVDGTAAYTEGGAAEVLSNTTDVDDVDNLNLVSATVTITDFVAGDVLSAVTDDDIDASYNALTGVLTLTGLATVAKFEAALQSVTYHTTSDNPTNFNTDTTRTITWAVNDGSLNNTTPLPETTLTITAQNDAPDIANVTANVSYLPNDPFTTLSSGTTVTDADNQMLSGATVQITAGLLAGDELSINGVLNDAVGVNGITWTYTAATGLLTLAGSSLVANYEALIKQVQYRSTNGDPTNSGANLTRTVTWLANDGALSSVTETTTIVLNGPPEINDPNNNAAFVFAENSGPLGIVSSSIQVTDDSTPNLASATIVLTNRQAGDVMTVSSLAGLGISATIDTSNLNQITVTLTGSASPDNYEEALKRVFFDNPGENPSTVQRAITITVNDGTLDSADETTTIDVVSLNDAPVNNVPASLDVEANHSLAISTLSIVDVDAEGDSITMTLSVAQGVLAVGTVGGGATVGGNGTATVTLTGTVAQINTTLAAANNVAYTPTADFFGTDTLTVTTNDGGNNGLAGGVLSDSDLVTINVNTLTNGTTADNSFVALAGNQRINGLSGVDTVEFGFKLTEATVTYEGNRIIIDGPSGSHTVMTGIEQFKFTDGTVDNNDDNRLIDDLFYYSRNHDVWNAGVEADQHYDQFGWEENRDPSYFFSTNIYLSANPDVKAAGVNPLDHWQEFGFNEGRTPSLQFDPVQYLAANADVAAAGVDPLSHYLQFGYDEGREPFAPSELVVTPDGFDFVYYLNNNPDVQAANVDPYQHFKDLGWLEGRDPNALFDTAGYLSNYGDVADAGINPLDHYNEFGWKEGRDPSAGFDTTAYLAAYPDVAAAGVNPLWHFIKFGFQEGRSAQGDGIWG